MKKVKTVVWLIILGFIGVVIFQNWSYFDVPVVLKINLGFTEYPVPEFPNIVFLVVCFAMGLLIAYFHSFVERFKSSKLEKDLRAANSSQIEEISKLKHELEALQKSASESDSNPETSETTDSDPNPIDD
ncbi:MAG: LapA family protein [Desulfobacterales bacterium]